jgi:hypothetical protein
MIEKCANPECSTEFRYASRGRLFSFELRNPAGPCRDVPRAICEKKPSHAAVHFWLCDICSPKFTLQFTLNAGLSLLPVPVEDPSPVPLCRRQAAASEVRQWRTA